MVHRSSSIGISLGLVCLTVALLLAADLAGLIPGSREVGEARLAARKQIVDVVAGQVALSAQQDHLAGVRASLDAFAKRDSEVLAAALRGPDGRILVQ